MQEHKSYLDIIRDRALKEKLKVAPQPSEITEALSTITASNALHIDNAIDVLTKAIDAIKARYPVQLYDPYSKTVVLNTTCDYEKVKDAIRRRPDLKITVVKSKPTKIVERSQSDNLTRAAKTILTEGVCTIRSDKANKTTWTSNINDVYAILNESADSYVV